MHHAAKVASVFKLLTTVNALVLPSTKPKGKCLNFLHIPNTGGNRVEADSKVLADLNLNAHVKGWGKQDGNLRCSHPMTAKGKVRKLPWQVFTTHCRVDLQSQVEQTLDCDVEMIPPSLDNKAKTSYEACETFCIVRDPLDRLLNEAMQSGVPCDRSALETFVKEYLAPPKKEEHESEHEAKPLTNDACHKIPQAEYVYGGVLNGSMPGTYCQHVLRFEHLDTQFEKLMENFSLPIRLISHEADVEPRCKEALSAEVESQIYENYRVDFQRFGYRLQTRTQKAAASGPPVKDGSKSA